MDTISDTPSRRATRTSSTQSPRIARKVAGQSPKGGNGLRAKFRVKGEMKRPSRHLIVSDVHGDIAALRTALRNIGYVPEDDVLISLGDTIDRGTDSRACLEYFADLKDRGYGLVMITGNHEDTLVAGMTLDTPAETLVPWLTGGYNSGPTLDSYGF
jgi:hypothetical protein